MSDFGWFVLAMIAFMALIGLACWVTTSAVPLWALLLLPSYKSGQDKEKD